MCSVQDVAKAAYAYRQDAVMRSFLYLVPNEVFKYTMRIVWVDRLMKSCEGEELEGEVEEGESGIYPCERGRSAGA